MYDYNNHDIADLWFRDERVKPIKALREWAGSLGFTTSLLAAKKTLEDVMRGPVLPTNGQLLSSYLAYLGRLNLSLHPEPEVGPSTMMGSIIGWRAFLYGQTSRLAFYTKLDRPVLQPLSFHGFNFNVLGINEDTSPEPDTYNSYGFWAFKDRQDIDEYAASWEGWCKGGYRLIFATVSLSGTVVEHEVGYRASNLEILGLYSKDRNSTRRGIANKLGWPGKVLPLADGPMNFEVNLTEIPNNEL